MQLLSRAGRTLLLLAVFGLGAHFALEYGTGGLWRGLRAAHAVVGGSAELPYDLTELRAINATLDTVRKKYVEPERVDPRQMFLSALDRVQMEVAPVIITHDDKSPTVKVQIFDKSAEFRVDNVQGPWDVAARLREVFAFIQPLLKTTKVNLPEVEYAAANGILRTLDPHSVFLSPEEFREMNVSTSGHFGGLGIVISIRDQMLTVMRPMPGTPAGRAGLKRLDRIMKINSESTLNMPLEDAVDRLRGDPGSKVTVWVERQGKGGWSGSRPFELVREVIQVNSVEHEKLDGGIGYVRLKQFQATTAKELEKALSTLNKDKSLNALVMDLRDNPGGLLDQAGKVADMFLDSGLLYATEGHSEGRREQPATRPGTQPGYPIVVIVNGSSASASEIVSGALKNQDRAVVIGETTFGKGSVQLVFPDVTAEGAALKLTIAQYLTPGDISIQGTGVVPDIELEAMTADTLEMNLIRDDERPRERDLNRTLGAGGRRVQEPPEHILRFNLPESVRAEIRERGSQLDDEFRMDAPIRIARELASRMRSGSRKVQLEELRPVLGEIERRELKAVSEDLAKLGIDWSPAPVNLPNTPRPEDLEVTVRTDRAGDIVTAGESMSLIVSVTNKGKVPFHRFYAVTKSDTGYYDERELVFGRVLPGETKTAIAALGWCDVKGRKPGSTKPLEGDAVRECRLPMDAVSRQDAVRIQFSSAGTSVPLSREFLPTIQSLPRPTFAYSYHIADNRQANQNGQLERGEGATFYLRVKNIGSGPTYETQANLRNLTGEGLLLKAGRFDLSGMKAGEEREVEFTFDILPALSEAEIHMQISIVDSDLGVGAGEKIVLPVVAKKDAVSVVPSRGAVVATTELALRGEPLPNAQVIGRVEKDAVLTKLGDVGAFVQVELSPGQFAFAERASLTLSTKAPTRGNWQPTYSHHPPDLEVQAKALSTREDFIEISGAAEDNGGGVEDVVIFVGNQKVYYQPNSGADKTKLSFTRVVPLDAGVNIITVVARESEENATRRTVIVRRDGPNGEILPTPKNRTFGEGWEFISP